jgi:hypothetical protein
MAFVELPKTKTFGRNALGNTVRAHVQNTGTVVIRVSADIYEKMGAPAFCRVMVGTDDHTGRIAVLPRAMKTAETRALKLLKGNKSPIFDVGAKRIGVNTTPRKTITLPHEISEHGLIIDVRPLMKPVASVAAA